MKQQESKAVPMVDPAGKSAEDEVHILENCPDWWDDYPVNNRSFFQSSCWGKYLERGKQYRVIYCYRKVDGIIRGTLLAYLAPVESTVAKLLKLNKLYWHQGPLLAETDDLNTAGLLIKTVCRLGHRNAWISAGAPYLQQPETGGLFQDIGNQLKIRPGKWATYLVDCNKPEVELWQTLRPEARRSVRKMEKLEFEIKWLDKNDIPQYIALLQEYRANNGLRMPPFFPTEDLWDQLGPEMLGLPAAVRGKKIHAVWPIIKYQASCFFFASAIDTHLQGRDRSVNDLVQWEIIKKASGMGLKTYDLAGVTPSESRGKDFNIKKFKSKWGGRYVEYATLTGGMGSTRGLANLASMLMGREKQ